MVSSETIKRPFLVLHVCMCRPDINACKEKTEDAHYVNGVLGGLKSLHDVGNLWEAAHVQDVSAYHAVLFLRADTFYKQGFPVDVLANIKVPRPSASLPVFS